MFERFDQHARQAVVAAQEQARGLRHSYIGTEHLLLGILDLPPETAVRQTLRRFGHTAEAVREQVERMVGQGAEPPSGSIPFTPRAKKVLELSLRESLQLRNPHIGPEHLLLGILRERTGVAAQVLSQGEASLDELRAAVTAGLPNAVAPGTPAGRTPAAEQVLSLAEELATGAPVGSHHLLEALARTADSMAGHVLTQLRIDVETITGKIDELDVDTTSDVTPEQSAAARLQWRLGAGEVALVSTDPALVDRVRALAELVDGELRGDGPLVGPFIGLHRAMQQACAALEGALRTEPGTAGAAEPLPAALRARLRRRGQK